MPPAFPVERTARNDRSTVPGDVRRTAGQPAPNGLFGATQWTDEDGPLRWLPSGVDVRVFNYGGGTQFGVDGGLVRR